jgi:perosamine synthetase
MRDKPAIDGGKPLIGPNRVFKHNNNIGIEEKKAVNEVLDSGVLSQYIGAWHPNFMGGPRVQELEKEWASYFGVNHAIAVNSWTSGLIAAVGAIGIHPGDEVIVTPWTMSATTTAILIWGGIPVFADIEPNSFCLDPISVRKKITSRTKAIVSVDIFGQSANVKQMNLIASEFGLMTISDTAQAPGATVGDRYAGTLSDIGGFSLNYHKHIHAGEGGVLVTNNDDLAFKLRLIRNHAESVVAAAGVTDIVNMVGFNFRMGEMEAAIAKAQLNKLSIEIKKKQRLADRLIEGLSGLRGLIPPETSNSNSHVYYVVAFRLDTRVLKTRRDQIYEALLMEGVPSITKSYQNLHLLPMFIQKTAFGRNHYPWSLTRQGRKMKYGVGSCPVAERIQNEEYLGFNICEFDFSEEDIDQIVLAFKQVWSSSIMNW